MHPAAYNYPFAQPDPPGFLPISTDQWLYYLTLATVLLLFGGAANLIRSRSGRAIMAIRDNPIAAAAMGINNKLYKTATFGASAAYTGVAGALSAIVIGFVAPDSFNFLLSVSFLVGLVIGGVGSIPGCLFGGLFVLYVPNIANSMSATVQMTMPATALSPSHAGVAQPRIMPPKRRSFIRCKGPARFN